MTIGEHGIIVQIPTERGFYKFHVFSRLNVGDHVTIQTRPIIERDQPPFVVVKIGYGTVILSEGDAEKIIVKIRSTTRPYWERPDLFRPRWPFTPYRGVSL